MSRPYYELLSARGAYCCVECGKCVALCPMAETVYPLSRDASPRGLVQQALQGLTIGEMPALRHCLQCYSCSLVCPAGVDVAGLIADLRKLSAEWKPTACVGCGSPLLPATAAHYLKRTTEEPYEVEMDYPSLCPDCKRRAYVRNNS